MADTYDTLANLIVLNDKNANDLGVTDLMIRAPFIAVAAATVSSNGTLHKYIKETVAPVVGFRQVNQGRFNSAGTEVEVTATLEILDASFALDKALADGYKGGPDGLIQRKAKQRLQAALFAFEKQVLNGTIGGDADGFAGLADTLTALSNAHVVNAQGTTASTGSSVYGIRTNNEGTDFQLVIGNDGQIKIDPSVITQIRTEDEYGVSTGNYPGYYTAIQGWTGIQYGSLNSVGRIANLTADSGKGLTDKLISDLLATFPANLWPDFLVMSRRSVKQLQQSRTATNATGAPAPFPIESQGVTIVVTDALSDTETLLS